MVRASVADVVAQMTGTWSPGPGVTKGDLEEARSTLATALLLGDKPQQLRTTIVDHEQFVPTTVASRPAIEEIVRKLKPPKAPQVRPFVRSSTDFDPTALASVAGMKASKTLGPFFGPTRDPTFGGLPPNSPLSILAVELLPGGVDNDLPSHSKLRPAAAVGPADPLGSELARNGRPQRILRVSPLVPVAPIC